MECGTHSRVSGQHGPRGRCRVRGAHRHVHADVLPRGRRHRQGPRWHRPPSPVSRSTMPCATGTSCSLFNNGIFTTWVQNSLVVGIAATTLAVCTAVLAGYALAKLRFPGRKVLRFVTLLAMVMPNTVLVIPIFLEVSAVDAIGEELWPVILIMASLPLRRIPVLHPLPDLAAARADRGSAHRWPGRYLDLPGIAVPLAKQAVALVRLLLVRGQLDQLLPTTGAVAASNQRTVSNLASSSSLAPAPSSIPPPSAGLSTRRCTCRSWHSPRRITIIPLFILFIAASALPDARRGGGRGQGLSDVRAPARRTWRMPTAQSCDSQPRPRHHACDTGRCGPYAPVYPSRSSRASSMVTPALRARPETRRTDPARPSSDLELHPQPRCAITSPSRARVRHRPASYRTSTTLSMTRSTAASRRRQQEFGLSHGHRAAPSTSEPQVGLTPESPGSVKVASTASSAAPASRLDQRDFAPLADGWRAAHRAA